MSSPRNVAKMVRELVHLRRQRRVAASTGGWARVLRSYEGAGARVHLGVRGWSCPFEQLAGLVPEDGEVLDLGCGSGHFSLLLAHQHPKQRVLGVDLDERKLARAAAARSELLADDDDRVRFELVTSTWRPSRSFRAIVLVDVLYLVDPEDRASLVRNLADRLEPDGVLLIKEMDTRRRMRMVPVHIGELFMTRLTGITRSNGRPLRLPGVRSIERWMAAGGLEVDRRPLRGRVAPHVAVVGRRAR